MDITNSDNNSNNTKKNFQGLFLLEGSGVSGSNAGDAVYLTDEEREKLKGKATDNEDGRIHVRLLDVKFV